MLNPRFFAFALALSGALFGAATGTFANTVTWSNAAAPGTPSTEVEAYPTDCTSSCSPTGFFGGSAWGPNLGGPNTGGSEYQTTLLTASFSANGTGPTATGTVTLVFNTLFATTCTGSGGCGVDPLNSTPSRSVFAGDIFLSSGSGANGSLSSTQTFNYAIALGYTKTSDGGLGAGVYSSATTTCTTCTYGGATSPTSTNSEDKTSDNVWSQAPPSGYDYGGAFSKQGDCTGSGSSLSCNTAVYSPTVVTGGANTGLTVSDCWNDAGTEYSGVGTGCADTTSTSLEVNITGSEQTLATIFDNYDIFWGTGDCSNAPIWGNLSMTASVPEPSSLALLFGSVIGFVYLRRRKRMTPTAA